MCLAEVSGKRTLWISATSFGPGDELGQIDPPIGGLAVMDPALGLFQPSRQLPLGQAGLFAQHSQEGRHAPIS
jgi:hypothetical protein